MASGSLPATELDENLSLDSSTAPTTPEGSLSFSPVLRPLRLGDGVDEDLTSSRDTSRFMPPISSTVSSEHTRVQNICCVGAGYVGVFSARPLDLETAATNTTQGGQPLPSSPFKIRTSKSPLWTGIRTESEGGTPAIPPSTSPDWPTLSASRETGRERPASRTKRQSRVSRKHRRMLRRVRPSAEAGAMRVPTRQPPYLRVSPTYISRPKCPDASGKPTWC